MYVQSGYIMFNVHKIYGNDININKKCQYMHILVGRYYKSAIYKHARLCYDYENIFLQRNLLPTFLMSTCVTKNISNSYLSEKSE